LFFIGAIESSQQIYSRGYLAQSKFNGKDGSVTEYPDSVTENQRVEMAERNWGG
jgi:hypothetical protein